MSLSTSGLYHNLFDPFHYILDKLGWIGDQNPFEVHAVILIPEERTRFGSAVLKEYRATKPIFFSDLLFMGKVATELGFGIWFDYDNLVDPIPSYPVLLGLKIRIGKSNANK